MARNGRILVVGGMKKNWEDFLSEPRIILWVDGEADAKQRIPTGVVQVVASHFVSHPTWERVVLMAKKQGIAYSVGTKGPGEIKAILTGFRTRVVEQPKAYVTQTELLAQRQEDLAEPTKKEETKVEVTRESEPISLTQFIQSEAKFDAINRTEEIKRLVELGKSRGITGGIPRVFYKVRAELYGNLRTRVKMLSTSDQTLVDAPRKSCRGPECVIFLKKNASMFGVAVLEIIQYAENLADENARLKAELAPVAKELKRLRRLKELIRKVAK